MSNQKIINIPIEYKRLFDTDWREAGIYGGRYCFTGDTLIAAANGTYCRIDSLTVGDRVLSLEGVDDTITDVVKFSGSFYPKPMLEIVINDTRTNTTYDHKYFNGTEYVPLYQLVWRIMAPSQRRTLELLCEQYGEDTHNELQRWLQNIGDETSSKPHRVFNNCCGGEGTACSQNNSSYIHTEPSKQGDSESQERDKNRQSGGEYGVGDTTGAVLTPLAGRITNRPSYTGSQLQENDGGTSARIVAVSLKASNYANTHDVGSPTEKNWPELRWDTGFVKWQDMEASASGVPTQEANGVGSTASRIEVSRVYESVDVWSITTEKYHNYFANGVNVSNSLKSHTVARFLLIRARQQKTRIACFREFQNSIAESSHQLLADLIKQYELTDFEVTNNSIVNKLNGSDFLFKGLWHNEQSIKSIEGIDIAWVEEAQTVSKSSLEVLTPTIRKPGSQIVYSYNRLLEDDPVHTRLVIEGRPNTLIIHVNYDVAEKYGWLPDNIKLEIEDDKARRPSLYKHKWLGEPNSLERLIYRDWGNVDEIPQQARLERGWLDYGYTNDPTAMGEIWFCDGAYYLDEVTYAKGLSNKQIADIILNRPKKVPWVADSAEPKSNDELRLHGVVVIDAQKGKDSVNNGIQAVQAQRIFVTRRSINIIKERANYMWEEDKDGRIINVPSPIFNHHMDGIRYGITSLAPLIARQEMLDNYPRYETKEQINPAY